MLSVVIPTRNEERYIGKLLNSLERQKFDGLEVIVADADSKDKTREIAENYGARVTSGGLSPAKGRNKGIKEARGEDILFLDADVILPDCFLKENYGEFVERDLDIATTFDKPLSDRMADKIIFYFINKGYSAFEKSFPATNGYHIFVGKEWFDRVQGFREDFVMNEDLDFVQRIWKAGGKFGVLHGPKTEVSVRRLNKEGRTKFILKGLYGILRYRLGRPMLQSSRFKVRYDFDGYEGVNGIED